MFRWLVGVQRKGMAGGPMEYLNLAKWITRRTRTHLIHLEGATDLRDTYQNMTEVCKAGHRDEGTMTKLSHAKVVKTAEKGAKPLVRKELSIPRKVCLVRCLQVKLKFIRCTVPKHDGDGPYPLGQLL